MKTEIGDRKGEASCYGNLGTMFKSLGQFDKVQEHLQKALVITTEIGDRKGEASCYGSLGTMFNHSANTTRLKSIFKKRLS